MNIADIVERVITETGRPDLETLIRNTVVSAIRQCHAKADFARDVVEETIQIPSPSNFLRLTLPPRFRKFHAMAIADQYGRGVAECKQTSTSTVLAGMRKLPQREPSYYISGATYTVAGNLNYPLPIQFLYVQYLETPALDNLGGVTWMTELYPEVIINYALHKVHSKTGNDTKAGLALNLHMTHLQDLINDQEVVV